MFEQVDHSRNDSLINVLGHGTSRQRVEPDDKTGATISGCYYRVVNHPLDRQFAEGVHGGAQTARHAVPPHGLAQRAVKTGHPGQKNSRIGSIFLFLLAWPGCGPGTKRLNPPLVAPNLARSPRERSDRVGVL